MKEKNNLLTLVLVSFITAFIVGGVVYYWEESKVSEGEPAKVVVSNMEVEVEEGDPLLYIIEGVDASVSKDRKPFPYTADDLFLMNQECGNNQSFSYFDNLVSVFADAEMITYKFKYTNISQEPDTYIVTLISNKAAYSSLDQFSKDFDLCYAGGNKYPYMLNEDWLVFVGSCGTGFSDDSGRPIGCVNIRDAVEPTLKLK